MAKKQTTPMSQDDLTELLSRPAMESGADERAEEGLRGAFADLAQAVGAEAFIEMGTKLLLAHEKEIRAWAKPGDAALERLNRYHRERGQQG